MEKDVIKKSLWMECARRGVLVPESFEVQGPGGTPIPRKQLLREAKEQGIQVDRLLSTKKSRSRIAKEASIKLQLLS
ncbi:MAG: hypothetical protein ACQGVC_04200 [Myxococcota bacterium]